MMMKETALPLPFHPQGQGFQAQFVGLYDLKVTLAFWKDLNLMPHLDRPAHSMEIKKP